MCATVSPLGQTTGTTEPICFAAQRYTRNKASYVARIRRIEGQARGVARMIGGEQCRTAVLTQLSALIAALRSLGLGLVDDHMKNCVGEAARRDPESTDAALHEVSEAIARLSRGMDRAERTEVPAAATKQPGDGGPPRTGHEWFF